ncbi:MAG: HIT family protein [Bacteroidetes bacterium]|nr:HIT family protein [Bacteroidota bacterium]
MSSIFSRIINKEIPAYVIAENDEFLAFLDITPIAIGHCLVIPKTEVDYIFDLEDQAYQNLFLFAKQVASQLKQAIPCRKIGVAVVGLEVPHAHIHLVPMNTIGDLNFSGERLQLTSIEFEEIQQRIIQS